MEAIISYMAWFPLFITCAKSPHSKRKWRTVNGASQPTHCGCSSPCSKNEWVTLVWPKRSWAKMTSSFLMFRTTDWYSPIVGFISRSLFPMLLYHEVCHFSKRWLKIRNRILKCLLTIPRPCFFHGSFLLFIFCVCHALLSVHCSLVVTYWERAGHLALLYVMFYCVFVTFPCGVLGQVYYLIVSIHDLCLLTNINVSFECSLIYVHLCKQ